MLPVEMFLCLTGNQAFLEEKTGTEMHVANYQATDLFCSQNIFSASSFMCLANHFRLSRDPEINKLNGVFHTKQNELF